MTTLPNFLIIGAAKSGTTTLHAMLRKHPDIFLPEEKDFKFFDDDENYQKGNEWYLNYFKKTQGQKVIGEANSEYLFSKKAAQRIREDLGEDVKLIAIIRNPIDRSFSEYLHQKRYNVAHHSFDKYIEPESDLFDTIIGRSQYSKHIQNYWSIFPKENIKIVVLEELKKNPQGELNKIYDFLGVSSIQIEQLTQANKAYTPKYKWLNDIVLQPNILRKFFKLLIPSFSVRQKIRETLQKLNKNTNSSKPVLSDSQRELLRKKYFDKEKQELKAMLNENFKSWE